MSDLKSIRQNIKLLGKERKKEESVKQLLKEGKEAIAPLAESIIKKDKNNEIKIDLLDKLTLNHGEDILITKLEELYKEKQKYHSKIAWLAWRLKLRSASNLMFKILEGKDKNFAFTALTDWDIQVSFEIIKNLIDRPDTKDTAIKALRNHNTAESLNLAAEYIHDEDESTREKAYSTLGVIGTKETLYKLAGKEDPENSYFRNAVKSIIKRVSDTEIEKEIINLEKIGNSEGFLALTPGGNFDENCRNKDAVKIGETLNRKGGKESMELAALGISLLTGTVEGRELEAAWKGTGSWL